MIIRSFDRCSWNWEFKSYTEGSQPFVATQMDEDDISIPENKPSKFASIFDNPIFKAFLAAEYFKFIFEL